MAGAKSCSRFGTSSAVADSDVMCLVTALTSAACEWFLILLLFLNGMLSYFMREFARYCKLPAPCLLCSRLDHYFGNGVQGSYQSMFCHNHRLEIFAHHMCEDCLISCAANDKYYSESQRRLTNKMSSTVCQANRSDNGCNEVSACGSVEKRTCSCCGKILASRKLQRRAIRYRSPVRRVSKPNIPLPNEPWRESLSHRDRARWITESSSGSIYSNHLSSVRMDHRPNVGYRVVKVTSDSESEAPYSDCSDGRIMAVGTNGLRKTAEIRNTSESLADAQTNILAHVKPVSKISTPAISSADKGKADIKMLDGLQNFISPALPELLSSENNAPMYNPTNDPLGEAIGERLPGNSVVPASTPAIPLDIISLSVPCQPNQHIELSVKAPLEKPSIGGTNHEHTECVDTLSSSLTSVEDKHDVVAPLVANDQATSLFVSNKGSQASDSATNDLSMKIHNGIEEERQLSSTNGEYVQGTELESNITSSTKQGDYENSNSYMTPGSGESMTPREVDSYERNESTFESTAGSVVSDIEGESLVDRLKRQIEYDKERIALLYKELDEERSASAIATNQAMAMITRLQEEKAAINMEALHYLRMMEDQAEYDVQALEKANDLLTEKEKEIQDLEAELEHYRSEVSDGLVKEQKSEMAYSSKDELSSDKGIGKELEYRKRLEFSNGSEFEREKSYILECLRRLEQALCKFTSPVATTLMPNGVNPEMMEHKEQDGSQPGDYSKDSGLSNQEEILSNGNSNIAVARKPRNHMSEASDKHDGSEEVEVNHDGCELSLGSLQIGQEGLLITQEIAHQLQELRGLILREHYVVP